jgi:hypothetical protein
LPSATSYGYYYHTVDSFLTYCSMLQALVISNGIAGLESYFRSNDRVHYHFAHVAKNFRPVLSDYDLLVVPNGSDHVAMGRLKDEVRAFLEAGKVLFCFDGWFTDWVPGNQWVMDNTKKTIDVRYRLGTDRYKLFHNVSVESLIYSHGISGWWACGYIEANPAADVLLFDTWNRPVMVLDQVSTAGIMVLTASGPLIDASPGNEEKESGPWPALHRLYQNLIGLIIDQKQPA